MRFVLCLVLLCLGPPVQAERLLVLGDSISAAYGIDKDEGWVRLLERHLDEQCPAVDVYNASTTGETSAGGLARLPGLLERHDPEVVVIELGGNDGLRGLPPERMKQNLAGMISMVREAGAQPVLFGMRIPPNYGEVYSRMFEDAFAAVAERTEVAFLPFFLEGVAGEEDMMQEDGIHPSATAQPRLLENARGALDPLLAPWCGDD